MCVVEHFKRKKHFLKLCLKFWRCLFTFKFARFLGEVFLWGFYFYFLYF